MLSAINNIKLTQNKYANRNTLAPNVRVGSVNPLNKSFSVISFQGSENPKQIALISLEAVPINKSGGMADQVGELTSALIDKGFDARLLMPVFNAPDGMRTKNGVPIFLTPKGKEFKLEDTGIEFDYKYGVQKEKARIYKVNDSQVKYPAYVIHCPNSISKNKTEYQGWIMDQMKNQASFCKASLEALKKLDNEKENFKPKFVMSHDWTSSLVMEYMSKDPHFKKTKKIYSICNLGESYQGMVGAPVAAPYLLTPKEMKALAKDEKMRYLLDEINKAVISRSGDQPNISISKEIKSGNYEKAYMKVATNYEKYIPYTTNHLGFLDSRTMELTPQKPWDRGIFNCSTSAIKAADAVTICSQEYLKEIQSEDAYTGRLKNILNMANLKSNGITIAIDYTLNNPADTLAQNPKALKYPFSINEAEVDIEKGIYDVKTGKAKNKECLQEILSQSSFDKFHKNQFNNFYQYGHLKKDSNAFLSTFITRFDPLQKGIDITIEMASKILKNNPSAQIVLAGPNFEPDVSLIKQYIDKVVKKYPGRAVLCNGFIDNINQFYAGSDAVLIPSRFGPFELVQLQGMRMGAIPIVSNTGGLKEVVVDVSDADKSKVTGFKTKISLLLDENPVSEYSKTVQRAIDVHQKDKGLWNKLTKNCMETKRDWQKTTQKYINTVFDLKSYNNIPNLFYVDDKLCAGGAPQKTNDLKFLYSKGIRNIINLGVENKNEAKKAESLGFAYHHIKLDKNSPRKLDPLVKILKLIATSKGSTFVHDAEGKDILSEIASVYKSYKHGTPSYELISNFWEERGLKPFEELSQEESFALRKKMNSFSNLGKKLNHDFTKLSTRKIKNTLFAKAKAPTKAQLNKSFINEYKNCKRALELVKSGRYYL